MRAFNRIFRLEKRDYKRARYPENLLIIIKKREIIPVFGVFSLVSEREKLAVDVKKLRYGLSRLIVSRRAVIIARVEVRVKPDRSPADNRERPLVNLLGGLFLETASALRARSVNVVNLYSLRRRKRRGNV